MALALFPGMVRAEDGAAGFALKATPRLLEAPQVIEALKTIRTYTEIGLSSHFEVEGEKVFEGQALVADILVFKPGSRLVLSASSLGGASGDRYIVARLIKIPLGSTPTITWRRAEPESTAVSVPPPVGKASPGVVGSSDGLDGGPGADGLTGNAGYPGRSAPVVYLLAKEVAGGQVKVDLRGEDGGPGGEGQIGGNGGLGRPGHPAIPGILDCRAGGGNGGSGGKGGRGGNGGDGGKGGNGGTLVLLSTKRSLAAAIGVFNVEVSPGKGGPGGNAGDGGTGGPPGQGGSGAGLCSGGAAGREGERGSRGEPGLSGSLGAEGDFAATLLTDEQVNRALRPE